MMARARSGQSAPIPRAGEYPIDTGTATLEPDPLHPDGWLLSVNGVQSSHVVIGRPEELSFEYMRWIAAGIDAWLGLPGAPNPGRLRVTHLGGAGCSLARHLAAAHPGSRHTVVELDAALAGLVRGWFDIPRAPTVKIRVGEARAVTESFADASRDVIIRDAFAGAVTPKPLVSAEFFAHAHRALALGGLLVLNCGDTRELAGARAEIAGLLGSFEHVAAIADPPMLKGRRYGNIILLASDVPLPEADSDDATRLARTLLGGAVPAHYKDDRWTRRLASGATPFRD